MGLPLEIHDQHSKSCHVNCSNKAVETMLREKENVDKKPIPKKLCICSDTTHAGSFRCRMHRKDPSQYANGQPLLTHEV